VNNTGIQTFGPLLDVLEEDWDRVIRTNLKGCFLCTQRVGANDEAEWRRTDHQSWFRLQ